MPRSGGGPGGGPGRGGPGGGPGRGPGGMGPRGPHGAPPPHHWGWRRGGPGCGGCLFSFLFIIGIGVIGISGISSLIM